jgi:CheY-like chemotaxis protein
MRRVLVVDRDDRSRESTRLVLLCGGHLVSAARDLASALDLVRSRPGDWLAIVDHELAADAERLGALANAGCRVAVIRKLPAGTLPN